MLKDAFPDSTALIEKPKRLGELMTFMRGIIHPDFPFVERNKRYICFSNGVLDIIGGEIVDGTTMEKHSVPRHYINQPYNTDDIDTPTFDKVVKYQLQDEELYTYMLAFIGRLFYDVGQFDDFHIVPIVIGSTCTGKSTLASVISAMFDPGSVGTIDSRLPSLKSMHQKELIVAPDIGDRVANQLSSIVFKKMVCGEDVSVTAKPHTVRWNVPLFMCGCQHISFSLEKDLRHFVIFKFYRRVVDADSSIKDMIISS